MIETVLTVVEIIANGTEILISIKELLNNNEAEILNQFDIVKNKLSLLEYKYDDQTVRSLKMGLKFLHDSFSSQNTESCKQSLSNAYKEFTNLASLEQSFITKSLSGDIENRHLIAIGYWGRFLYFLCMADYNNCLIQVYECGCKYPDLAVKLFDKNFFTKDYESILGNLNEKISICQQKIEKNIIYQYGFIPNNQLLGVLEFQKDDVIDSIIDECSNILLKFNNKIF